MSPELIADARILARAQMRDTAYILKAKVFSTTTGASNNRGGVVGTRPGASSGSGYESGPAIPCLMQFDTQQFGWGEQNGQVDERSVGNVVLPYTVPATDPDDPEVPVLVEITDRIRIVITETGEDNVYEITSVGHQTNGITKRIRVSLP